MRTQTVVFFTCLNICWLGINYQRTLFWPLGLSLIEACSCFKMVFWTQGYHVSVKSFSDKCVYARAWDLPGSYKTYHFWSTFFKILVAVPWMKSVLIWSSCAHNMKLALVSCMCLWPHSSLFIFSLSKNENDETLLPRSPSGKLQFQS